MDNKDQSVIMPSVGRFVHYIPSMVEQEDRDGAGANGAKIIPALVIQVFEDSWNNPKYKAVNLTIFPDNGTTEGRPSAQHKSTAQPGEGYWVWPVYK